MCGVAERSVSTCKQTFKVKCRCDSTMNCELDQVRSAAWYLLCRLSKVVVHNVERSIGDGRQLSERPVLVLVNLCEILAAYRRDVLCIHLHRSVGGRTSSLVVAAAAAAAATHGPHAATNNKRCVRIYTSIDVSVVRRGAMSSCDGHTMVPPVCMPPIAN